MTTWSLSQRTSRLTCGSRSETNCSTHGACLHSEPTTPKIIARCKSFSAKVKSLRVLFFLLLFVCANHARTFAQAADFNALVLKNVSEMPTGGHYSTARVATIALQSSTHFEQGKFFVLPPPNSPSFCSGATYLVFLKTIEELRREGELTLDTETLLALMIRDGQRDGEGIWGRWNANGPGTARLFYELGIGRNFTDFAQAKPGDFMKIFWNNEVGKTEHGHSVIYLGSGAGADGVEYVRFWSSNVPAGFGEKTVPRTKIAQAIFSRLEHPENLARIKTAPSLDSYLASLTSVRSSFAEAKTKCGM